MVIRNQSEQQQAELQHLVGDCIHNWTLVEIQLSTLFAAHLQAKDHLSYVVWDSVVSFKAKLNCLDLVLTYCLKDSEIKEIWARLHSKISSAYQQRNELAHSGYITNSHTTSLVPYLSITEMITNSKNLKRLCANDLKCRSTLFKDLSSSLQWFGTISLSAPDTKYHIRAPRLITEICNLIAQKNKEPTSQPQSSEG